ncbi:MAG TPA: diacylglycerol kinase [Firmicutes bacterium]|nr:diacylglycerol kinase [Bacillota bacterium]
MRNKPNDHGVMQLRRAFNCSYHGLLGCWREESSFRKIVLLLVSLVPVAFLIPLTILERVLLILPLGIGLQVELLNSAIENVVDLNTQEIHPLAKKAKDMGSAAQFVNLVMLAVVWLLLLGSKIIRQ